LKSEIITTADGSKTIHFPEWNESYHSKHGAIQEAQHVYIQSGLAFYHQNNSVNALNLLEIGFGTGLNAMLSFQYAKANHLKLNYQSLEKYPLDVETLSALHYVELFTKDSEVFQQLHSTAWEKFFEINTFFNLKKIQTDIKSYQSDSVFDLIYFDAFGPRVQPALWEKPILQNMYNALKPNGVWVTYSCKGQVKRDLQDVGFHVEKLPGPPGKREMLRAIKL
jgi:tRNA U34 5-methylaminomethyl-2-thiouridine-forming methyltransferase MnmC